MSQENVEKVRAWLATWDREILRPETRPFERINSMAFGGGLHAPDTVYEDGVLPDRAGEPYRGLGGFNRAGETWIEQFEWMVAEMERISDADEQVVSFPPRPKEDARHRNRVRGVPRIRLYVPRAGKSFTHGRMQTTPKP
jgi:hypothetical protein